MKPSSVTDYYSNNKYHNIHTTTSLPQTKLPRSITTTPRIRDSDNLRPESFDD